ncbi:Uncharacterised protein [Bordetella pertussis]|nr:Uncharacterised protein [Bordetella pertussis]CFW47302.1 Uncharacterised protein [Bordetella pertussis]
MPLPLGPSSAVSVPCGKGPRLSPAMTVRAP